MAFDDLNLSPSRAHLAEIDDLRPALAWRNAEIADPREWQHAARTKLAALLGFRRSRQALLTIHRADFSLPRGMQRRRPLRADRTARRSAGELGLAAWRRKLPSHDLLTRYVGRRKFVLGARHWLQPIRSRLQVVRDYALQAAERGYLAVCVEQSCYGERQEREDPSDPIDPTFAAAIRVLQLGRTLLGDRVSDVVQVIDWLHASNAGGDVLPGKIDPTRVYLMGNSLGGATAMFAAALDARISGVIAASCISNFAITLGRKTPGPDYVIPGILRWLECADVIGLSAPRPFVTVSGTSEPHFPVSRR